MRRHLRSCASFVGLLIALAAAPAAFAQKQGGILREYMIDSPASMSIHEESTVVAERPVMGVFNNLVLFDQQPDKRRKASKMAPHVCPPPYLSSQASSRRQPL